MAAHAHHDRPHLSSAAQAYLLTIRSMAGAGEPARAAALSRRLGVSAQAASEMVGRLASDGLITANDRHELELTETGRAEADAIFRRHSLLEWLLTTVVGLSWAESDEEAARLQGSISPRVESRLAELLGNPRTCPHGNPIDAEAARTRPKGIRLSEAQSGDEVTILRITEEAEEDVELLSYLERHQLVPGTVARVVERSSGRDSISLQGPAGTSTIGLRPANLIRVMPGKADPSLFHRPPFKLAT